MAEDILEQSSLFVGLSPGLIQAIARLGNQERHSAGTVLFEAGRPAANVYILERGKVALTIKTEAREEVIFSTISKPGDVFAWSALVEPRLLTASAECLTDTSLIKLEGRKLEALFGDYPLEGLTIMQRLASLIATRLKETQKRLITSIS